MPFDARRWPDAVTLAWLIEHGMDVGLHCHPCGRHVVVPTSSLPFAIDTPAPAVAGRFQMHAMRITQDGGAARVAEAVS
jgi:hypothetical protein